ncbi:TIGR04388 family protein [Leptospira fluminis]|uniref:TIGR04388 family protein n=1 Tax=Leptospira fluminis TaxID=2484979 RepID=A0A4R9GRE2_9LEPT|nr:TIGR04388 family protein [Leptospira fluminis]TGK20119.1 TIGR04388 family protein [Leptospira fluminis]
MIVPVRSFGWKDRVWSGVLLASYLWLLVLPSSFVFSQAVTVPNFLPPQVQNQTLHQYETLANQSHSLDAWNQIVNQGFGVIKSSWEAQANLEIQALESSVNSQYANDPATAAYIDRMIESQASQSEQAWLNQIESQVMNDQNAFLASLPTQGVLSGKDSNSNYQATLSNGLQSFADSLSTLQKNYQDQLASISQQDAQYQQNLQQLQNYETGIRTNLQSAVTQLNGSLQNTALFYNTKVDGSTDWTSLNASGQQLQTLIAELNLGLQNGTSLSVLASEMTSYLQAQETQAAQNATYWTQQAQPHSLTNANAAVGFADYQLNGTQDLLNYANTVRSSSSAINAIMSYIDGGSNSQDPTLLSFLYSTYGYDPTKTQIVGINSADFTGSNMGYSNYSPFPVTLGHSGDRLTYSSSGLNAFDFTATGLWAFAFFIPVTAAFTEDTFNYTINFQVKDLTAAGNAQTWNGFATGLNSELGSWNTLTPAITNWESQVSAYQAQYAAWHAKAMAEENQLQIAYTNGAQTLDTEKTSWIASLVSMQSNASATSSGSKGEDDDEHHTSLDPNLPKITSILLPNANNDLGPVASAPSLENSGLNNVLSIFQQSLMASSNLALENQINQRAIDEKNAAVQQIANSLGKNAVVDDYGNITYTTAIEDGHAKLKDGGDATNFSDYVATTTNEHVYVGAPATISIANAAPQDLFQSWDTNAVTTSFQTSESSFNNSYNTALTTLNKQISDLNALNAKNDTLFQKEAQAEASFASDQKSLAQTLLQGGNFTSWVKSQIQDKVNSAVAQAIANATGMDPALAQQLVQMFEKNQAEKKAKAKAQQQEITTGLEVVGSIALSFVAGPEMLALGQAALQAVQGYQNGGVEGALVGAASGAVGAYARTVGVNVNVAYSRDGGFSAGLGVGSSSLNAGLTFSQHGAAGFNVGSRAGNLSYNPTTGFSGSVNLGMGNENLNGAMLNIGQHSGPSLTYQANTDKLGTPTGAGGSFTIDGKGDVSASATYGNATVATVSGNLHNPGKIGGLTLNDNFNNDLNQNLAMEKADANLEKATGKLSAGRADLTKNANEAQLEILNDPNASAQDKHNVLATLAKAEGAATDASSASSWLGRTAQDLAGNIAGSLGLKASDSNGFIDKNGDYVQRTCFTAGTLIRTKEGLKPIEKIATGDLVLSLNPETGEVSYKKVLRLFSKETPLIHRITYTNGEIINTTWNHPFYIRGKGFQEVKDIKEHDRSVTVASVRNSSSVNRSYGIQIGASLAALRTSAATSNSASWKEEIRGTAEIHKVEEIYEKTIVYNFEVEDDHTYFVGKNGVLVHNDSSCGPGYVSGLKEAIAAKGGELLGGQTVAEAKAEAAALREQAKNQKEFDAYYETGKMHVEVGKEAALWYSGERLLHFAGKGLIKGTEMFLGTEAGVKVASKVKGWLGAGEAGTASEGIARTAGKLNEGLLQGVERENVLSRNFTHDPTGDVVSGIENLANRLPKDKPVVVIGESMETRVNQVRDALVGKGFNVRTYEPRNFRSIENLNPKDVEANRSWIKYWTKEKGANIIDIGRDPLRKRRSAFYGVEVRSIYGENKYPNVTKYSIE